jgi:NAD(P)-dependent dehydrogenase (short-subunit alcohol dehydrogenase family)
LDWGRVAVITGGRKGIGKPLRKVLPGVAKGFGREGANVVLMACGKDELGKASDEIKKLNHTQELRRL